MKQTENKSTGIFIAACRRSKNLTQSDLAEILGVTDKAISRWETGKGYPEVTVLPKLAAVLDVTVSELLAGERIPEAELHSRAENTLLENLKRTRDRMYIGAGAVFLLGLESLILALKLWKSFGYASDAFVEFWTVMEEGGFDSICNILILTYPLLILAFSGYMLYCADPPKH